MLINYVSNYMPGIVVSDADYNIDKLLWAPAFMERELSKKQRKHELESWCGLAAQITGPSQLAHQESILPGLEPMGRRVLA